MPTEFTVTGVDSIPTVYTESIGTGTVCISKRSLTDFFNTNAQCYGTLHSVITGAPSTVTVTVTDTSTVTEIITEGAKAYGNLTNPYKYIGIGGGSLLVAFLVALKAALTAGIQDPFFAVFLGVFVALGVSLSSSFVYEGIHVLLQ
uniref:hypothetical protein n=1 Tax=Diaporthe sojae TaxID=165439 RepID=UPI0024104784|nr:hypothetical protein QAZ32_mgp21 [Diaporthe sojae]WET30418.1 hypothetical protein [Diaporthe sojae]